MKKTKVLLLFTAMTFMLMGCKASEAKIKEAEDARAAMITARDAAQETYLDITDSSKKTMLDELATKAAEIEGVDFSQMSEKKIDEYLPSVQEVTDSYNDLQGFLDGTLQKEKAEGEEAAKNIQIDAYAINKTGMNLTELVLHDVTKDTFSDNLMGEGVVLQSGYTLMGIELEIRSDSSMWEFLIKDENGTPYTLICDNLLEQAKDGVALTLEYDKNTEMGRAVFGSFVPSAKDVASEAASGSSLSEEAPSEAASN